MVPQAQTLGKSPFVITPKGLPFLPDGTPTLEFASTSNAIHWPVHIYGRDDFAMPSTALAPYETPTWTAPRATDANMIHSGVTPPAQKQLSSYHLEADEKFLFYRGLGHFDIPLKTTADQAFVHLENTSKEDIPFALAWEDDKIRWMGRLPAGQVADFAQDAVLKGASLASLAQALVEAGLYRDEALAMLTTWRTSYFGSPGLRVFWIVPRVFTDRTLPLQIQPAPQQLERVLVGRSEILTPAFEARLVAEAAGKAEDRRLLSSGHRYFLPYSERVKKLSVKSP